MKPIPTEDGCEGRSKVAVNELNMSSWKAFISATSPAQVEKSEHTGQSNLQRIDDPRRPTGLR